MSEPTKRYSLKAEPTTLARIINGRIECPSKVRKVEAAWGGISLTDYLTGELLACVGSFGERLAK